MSSSCRNVPTKEFAKCAHQKCLLLQPAFKCFADHRHDSGALKTLQSGAIVVSQVWIRCALLCAAYILVEFICNASKGLMCHCSTYARPNPTILLFEPSHHRTLRRATMTSRGRSALVTPPVCKIPLFDEVQSMVTGIALLLVSGCFQDSLLALLPSDEEENNHIPLRLHPFIITYNVAAPDSTYLENPCLLACYSCSS